MNTAYYYAITDADDKVSLTTSTIDPTSFCSIEVDTDTTLILSIAHQNEITKIHRHTGAIIWRMGCKNNQFNFINSSRPFTRQHDFRRLPNGNITMIDAGVFSTPFYSHAVEYAIDEKNRTATQVWEYDHNKTIQSTHKWSVQRLPNGNTLIVWGGFGGTLPTVPGATEVKPDGTIVFEVGIPSNDGSYRFRKFPWKTTLFELVADSINYGKWNGYTESVYLIVVKNNSAIPLTLTGASTRTPYFYVDEQFPITIPANDMTFLKVVFYLTGPTSVLMPGITEKWEIFPNPVRGKLYIRTDDDLNYRLELFDGAGKLLRSLKEFRNSGEISMTGLADGLYFLKITASKSGFTKTVRIVKNSK